MKYYARQGDIIINKLEKKLDEKIEFHKEMDVVLAGKYTSPHVIGGTVLVNRTTTRTYIRILEPTKLTHQDRHLMIPLPPGDYEVPSVSLRERNGTGDRPVED